MNPEAIIFGGEVTSDYSKAREKEWIITNGLGGYASSTIIGANTRGYHGLLVVSLPPSLRRILLLSKLEEVVVVNGESYPLSVNKYPGVIYPDGNKYLKEFSLYPYPSFLYEAGGVTLLKTVYMPPRENSVAISYSADSPLTFELQVRPLVTHRGFHSRTREKSGLAFTQHSQVMSVIVTSSEGKPNLYLRSNMGLYEPSEAWYRKMIFDEETKRGLNDWEDLYSPGLFKVKLKDKQVFVVAASVDAIADLATRRTSANLIFTGSSLRDWLIHASDQFVAKIPGNGSTLVAGYHWFGDWGRDAAIALPGLLLTTGRFEEAKEVLRRFLGYTRNGLVPIYFDEEGKPGYASIDTSLWIIYAVYKHYSYTSDLQFVEEIYPKLRDIVEWYQRGTEFVKTAEDSLLEAEQGEGSLTWMDARIDGMPVTPRAGKCVEVNALWFNALRSLVELSRKLSADPEPYRRLSVKVKKSFNNVFWWREGGYLYDYVKGDEGDDSIRPNQILSISLPFPVLERKCWESVLNVVNWHLFTPYGLRTLTPQDSRYRGKCVGSPRERDSAYHNGTVWPWLIGPFITAYVKLGLSPDSLMIHNVLQSFNSHLGEAGLGSVSEIFDGDTPHSPRGCIAQAWSVGELLRVISEDLKDLRIGTIV